MASVGVKNRMRNVLAGCYMDHISSVYLRTTKENTMSGNWVGPLLPSPIVLSFIGRILVL
jgi:hypothetical protein